LTVVQKICQYVGDLSPGVPFGYVDLGLGPNQGGAAAKALERMVARQELIRLTKGVYCVPGRGALQPKGPTDEQLINSVLRKNGKLVGYVTGMRLMARLGFVAASTTYAWEIAFYRRRGSFRYAHLNVKAVNSFAPIEEETIPVLELLDAVRAFNAWAQDQPKQGIQRLGVLCAALSDKQKVLLVETAVLYPAGTCALLGALISFWGWSLDLDPLRAQANPTSRYRCVASVLTLPTGKEWGLMC
jgi:hypothetical protein